MNIEKIKERVNWNDALVKHEFETLRDTLLKTQDVTVEKADTDLLLKMMRSLASLTADAYDEAKRYANTAATLRSVIED